ncbi:polyprenyl synthetase family protein [Spiractinospora alimapuensis]|uniref:polyprenyl synthetase family protein n=1 Tax=Spiractinospora alimapuensis TaxID=2820884 RepID=UPI001F20D280|nr:polyprenyl synthetase family protein [Spiractinospora alimapuensis]QVQ53209.1 polyprenyl synthetase family protein [Spiractinospora alimapuensis]
MTATHPDSRDPVAPVRPGVDEALTAFVARRRTELEEIGSELTPVLDALNALLSGGKRIRPVFCYWGWRGVGGEHTPAILEAAGALELLQACALIHDDVIDNSDTRRGMPATHHRLGSLHRDSAWSGDSAAFGRGAAILLGDLCLAWCESMFADSGLGEAALRSARPQFDAMRTEVMAGQYLDMVEQARETNTVEGALRVMRYKAAKYTVERPLLLGAVLAGGQSDLERVYATYGATIGVAFQLRDDVLGVFGDPERTGKPAGDDLREGKRTVLVAETIARAAAPDSARFQDLLGDPTLSAEDVAWMRDLIAGCGALAACEERIGEYAASARTALRGPLAQSLRDEARDALDHLIDTATTRTS